MTRAARPLLAWAAVAAAIGGIPGVCTEEAHAAAPPRSEAGAALPGWQLKRSMSQRRSYVAAAEIAGSIYVAGGMVGATGRHLATFQRYDPRADRWTTLPPLPVPLRAGAGAAIGRTFYVVGGQVRGGNGRQAFAYDVDRARWRAIAPLPEARFNHAAVALGGRIYVLGGYSRGLERRETFVYDPRADRWTAGAPLPGPLHAFGAVVRAGELWTIGGRRGQRLLREVHILDPVRGRWRDGPRLPAGMELLGAASIGGTIHAVHEYEHRILDVASGRWRSGPAPLVPRHALSLFASDHALFAIGGCTTSLHDSQVVERLDLPV